MMKTIQLLAPALIAGQMRYPAEGGISVAEDIADGLIADEQAEDIEAEDRGRAKTPKAKPAAED